MFPYAEILVLLSGSLHLHGMMLGHVRTSTDSQGCDSHRLEHNMTKHTVTLIPGDGIGLETTASMRRVVEAAGVDIVWEVADAGAAVMERTGGSPLPEETIESVRRNKVAIKGPITTPVGTGFRSVNVALRKTLDLYACVRPVLSIPGAGGRYENVDLVVVRENTEDLYAGIEFPKDSEGAQRLIEFCEEQGTGTIRPDSGISIKPISVTATERIVRYAFEYALAHGRRKVTAVHKANIMKHSDGLFLQVARNVAEEYAGRVDFDDRIVDAFCMNVVIDPSQFDVIVFPNLYGDIASDLCAGLVGGLGIAPGANIGEGYAIFEAVHGSAPDIAGKDLCNPTAEILSAAMMLDYLGEDDAAQRIREAVRKVYAEGHFITGDIRKATGSDEPACSCTEFTDALVAALS